MSRLAARLPQRWPALLALLVALLVPVGPVSARAHHPGDGAARAIGTVTPARAEPGTRRQAASDAPAVQVSSVVAWSAQSAVVTSAVSSPRPTGMWACAPEEAPAGPAAEWSSRCGRGPPVTAV